MLNAVATTSSRQVRATSEPIAAACAALAALGWVVLRFSYRRLTREPAACRAEILAVYRGRLSVVP